MKKNLILIFVLFISTLASAQTKIVMKKSGGIYLVPCKVNGLDMEFIFDTGASQVSISLVEAMYMLKQGKLTKNDIFGSSYAQLANGAITENTNILLREIIIGDLRLLNVKASIIHELGAPLLLGQSAIEKLGKIQLENNVLTILDKGRHSYDYSANEFVAENQANQNVKDYVKFNGQIVYKHSPILDKPDMATAKNLCLADDGVVEIIGSYNDKYLKVKVGDMVGYIWHGWLKME